MPISGSIVRRLLGLTALASTLVVAQPATAGVIGSFDPAFGPSIPNLGFRGTITLDVTPGCYALGGGFHATGGACQITAQSAQINYYNATTGSGVLTTVNLAASTFASTYVFGAYFDPSTGQLAGLDTNDSAGFSVAVTDSNPVAPIAYSGSMLLYFTSGFASTPITLAAFVPAAAASPFGGAFLVDCGPFEGSCSRGANTNSNRALVTFTTVPEPESLSLGVLGAVALAALRRRRRSGSAERAHDA